MYNELRFDKFYKQSVNPILDFGLSMCGMLKSFFVDSAFYPAFNKSFKGACTSFIFCRTRFASKLNAYRLWHAR